MDPAFDFAAHGLTPVQELTGFAADWIYRATDVQGRDVIVKSGDPAEYHALRHWQRSPYTPDAYGLYEQVHVRDYLTGVRLADLPDRGASRMPQVAVALTSLHRMRLPDTFSPPSATQWCLAEAEGFIETAEDPDVAAWLTSLMPAFAPGDEVLLHGDCYGRNLLLDDTRLWVFDPAPMIGHGEFDLACAVLMTSAPDLHALLARAADAYARPSPRLDAYAGLLVHRAVVRYVGDHGLAADPAPWLALRARLMAGA